MPPSRYAGSVSRSGSHGNGLHLALATVPWSRWHGTKSYEARAVMGVRTRGLDMQAGFRSDAADKAARTEAEAVIQRWNDQLALGRDMLWSPTIRAARRHAMARRVLPRLRHQQGDRSPHDRPASVGLCRHAGARPALFMVSWLCADAEATRLVRSAASEAGRRRGALAPACLRGWIPPTPAADAASRAMRLDSSL